MLFAAGAVSKAVKDAEDHEKYLKFVIAVKDDELSQQAEEIARLSRVLEVEQEGHAEDLARSVQATVAAERAEVLTAAEIIVQRHADRPEFHGRSPARQLARGVCLGIKNDLAALRAPAPAPLAEEDAG